jgi:hypothetical protein
VHSRAIPYFVEVELTLVNKGQTRLRLDPARFSLVPDQGAPVSPTGRDEVVDTLRSPVSPYVGAYGIFHSGSFGVAIGVGPLDLHAKVIESRVLRAGDLLPGASVRGSVYFRPPSWPAQFSLVLDGLASESGAGLPSVALRDCWMPFRPSEPPIGFGSLPPGLRTVPVNARAEAGPMALSVSSVEFTRDATTLAITVQNNGPAAADLFMAIADARLVDDTGKTYAVRIVRSDFPERVTERGEARGRLVFEPLPHPPAVTSARLTLPGIRAGGALYDLRVDLRF